MTLARALSAIRYSFETGARRICRQRPAHFLRCTAIRRAPSLRRGPADMPRALKLCVGFCDSSLI